MERNLASRAIIIAVVLGVAIYSAYPPEESIHLGLDLRGGMHLVLQVQTDDAVRAETDNIIESLERELEDKEITGAEFQRTGDSSFEIVGVPAERFDEIEDDLVDRFYQGWILRRLGDRLQLTLSNSEAGNLREMAVNQARETIRKRIDAFGVAEPVIHDEGLGSNRIVVQLPGVDDPQRVKDLIKNTAFLEFRLVKDGTGGFGSREQAEAANFGAEAGQHEVMEQDIVDDDRRVVDTRYWLLEKRRVVTGRDLKTARVAPGEFGEPTVSFTLSSEGGNRFGDVTGANVGRGLAIVLDGGVMSAPTINDRITTQGVIHGNFTQQEVEDLAMVLRSGALPAGLTYLEERTVGPTLGKDSIAKGKEAGMIGGLLVILAMLVVYKLTGINAVSALLLNMVLVFGFLAIFDATLTVPGIAGIVLTVGMAVDANVLIFERIREELRSGRTVKSAISAGFGKALSSIIDANVTTLIAATFLFMFGTGPIRGFAVTLSIGILASVFTAVFISRWLFDLINSRRQRVDKLSI